MTSEEAGSGPSDGLIEAANELYRQGEGLGGAAF
jgi:hypothetical protein